MMIAKRSIKLIIALFCVLITSVSLADTNQSHQEDHNGNTIDTPSEIKEYIQHHLKDSHDFHLFTRF